MGAAAAPGARAGVLQVELEAVGGGDDGGGGPPEGADGAVGPDALVVALAGELGDLGEDADAAAGEAHKAVDAEFVFVGGVRRRGGGGQGVGAARGPVRAAEEGLVVFAARERAQHVEVGEPAAEEVGDFVLAVHGLGAAAAEDHAAREGEVRLPGDGHFEGVGGDDFEGGEHDGRGEVGVGYGGCGGVERVPEGGEDVADPYGDTDCGLQVLQKASSVACGVGQKEVEEINVRDSHWNID